MARRPRTMDETFYDYFADRDVSDQAIMLRMLTEIHRQAKRGRPTRPEDGDRRQMTIDGAAPAAVDLQNALKGALKSGAYDTRPSRNGGNPDEPAGDDPDYPF